MLGWLYKDMPRDDRVFALEPLTVRQLRETPNGQVVLIESYVADRNNLQLPDLHNFLAYSIEKADEDDTYWRSDQIVPPLRVRFGDSTVVVRSYTLQSANKCVGLRADSEKYRHCGIAIGDPVVVVGDVADDFPIEQANVFYGDIAQLCKDSRFRKNLNDTWGPILIFIGVLCVGLYKVRGWLYSLFISIRRFFGYPS